MSTVFLLLDAFRQDYLSPENTPFLWKCAQEGEHYSGVEQSFGFCERTEILTGLPSDQSGFFTAIGFDPPNSPYADVGSLHLLNLAEQVVLPMLSLVPKRFGNKVHRRLRFYAQQYFRSRGISMPSFMIPYPWLCNFALTEDRMDLRLPEAFPSPSVLTLLTDAGRTYSYDTFTALGFSATYTSDQERLNAVIDDLSRHKKDLYLTYIASADAHGHRLGPESAEFRTAIQALDNMLGHFVRQAEAAAPQNRYLFVGDHGMLTVTDEFNAEKEIQNLLHEAKLKSGEDVLYFLDSTMVRFWELTDRARQDLGDTLRKSQAFGNRGAWMNISMARHFHAPWPDRRYGDHLWLADAGVLVFPDFYHRITPCKGMHGYDPRLPESQGICIHWGDGVPAKSHSRIPLTSVFDVLKGSLGL